MVLSYQGLLRGLRVRHDHLHVYDGRVTCLIERREFLTSSRTTLSRAVVRHTLRDPQNAFTFDGVKGGIERHLHFTLTTWASLPVRSSLFVARVGSLVAAA